MAEQRTVPPTTTITTEAHDIPPLVQICHLHPDDITKIVDAIMARLFTLQ